MTYRRVCVLKISSWDNIARWKDWQSKSRWKKVLDELTVMLEVECPGAHFAIFSVKGDQNFYLESAPQLPKDIVEEIRRKGLLKECHLIQGDCEHEDFEEVHG